MRIVKMSLLALTAAVCSVSAWAQSAEEVVKKHLESIGGEKNWKALESIKMTGSMSVQGMDIPLDISAIHKKGWRMDMKVMDMNNYQIVTDKGGWVYFPIQQQTAPEPMPEEMVKTLQKQLDIQGSLVDYKAKGNKLELMGNEELDGVPVVKLKMTSSDGSEQFMYFDAKTFYLLRESSSVSTEQGPQELVTNFSNYKALPGGLVMAMTIDSPQGPITFSSIEVNPKLDEALFAPSN